MDSDNLPSEPDDQQGRLESYLSGFADGEGTFSIGATRRPDLVFGFQLVPEFRVSQNEERASVLHVFRRVLGCGRILENHRSRANDRSMVLVVRRRADLVMKVIPFFKRNPLLSEKRRDFERFAEVVSALQRGEHLTRSGFEKLVAITFTMNGDGRYRKLKLDEILRIQNPQRLYAEHPVG